MRWLIWTLQLLLAVVFVFTGGLKLITPWVDMQTNAMWAYTQDFNEPIMRLIGVAELAGGIGMIVPALTGILPQLTGIAGVALALLMSGAVATHLRRGEAGWPVPLVLTGLALVVAYGRLKLLDPVTGRTRRSSPNA
jgi:hypothetical protein